MLTTALLALAATIPAAPAQTQPFAPRAVAVAVVRARIISSVRVTMGALPGKGQRNARNGMIDFE
jgi:NhaP-type Na+/H+ or K+/H+ antiporter